MDPSTGTFTSMDTYGGSLSDPMSLHKYMFANSNPVAYCDPGGHEASLQGMVAAMAISGILSAVDSGILYSLQNKDSDIEKYGKSVYGWNVATAAMNGFLNGFILGIIGYALCSILLVRLVLSAVGLSIGIQRASAGLDELESSGGNANRGLYNFLTGLLLIGVSTYGLSKSGSEILSKFGKGGNLIHLEGDPNIEGDGDWGDINKEIDDWYNSTHPKKSSSGPRFPEDPNKLFPEDYAGLTKVTKPNGNIDFIVEAGESTYKIEYHVKHSGDGHYNGNHYHVKKQAETPKPGKTKPPFFRVPNLDPDTPAQGGTFAPGDLLPTRNRPNGG